MVGCERYLSRVRRVPRRLRARRREGRGIVDVLQVTQTKVLFLDPETPENNLAQQRIKRAFPIPRDSRVT